MNEEAAVHDRHHSSTLGHRRIVWLCAAVAPCSLAATSLEARPQLAGAWWRVGLATGALRSALTTALAHESRAPAPQKRTPELDVGTLIGRFHPALVHFPIAWLLLLALFEWYAALSRRGDLDRLGMGLLTLTVVGLVAAATTGFILAGAHGLEQTAAVILHRNVELVAASSVVVAFVLRVARPTSFNGVVRWVYVALVSGGALVCLYGGHLGGKMVFGEAYLPY